MTTSNDTTRPEHAQPSPLKAADAAQQEFGPTPAGPVRTLTARACGVERCRDGGLLKGGDSQTKAPGEREPVGMYCI